MLGKRFLAGIFAAIILLKLIILAIYPQQGFMIAETLLAYRNTITIVSLAFIAITGFYIFSSLNLIDIALVMFFTSFLFSATSVPYFAEVLKFRPEIISINLGKAWWQWSIWGALAVAVLYKVFSPERNQRR